MVIDALLDEAHFYSGCGDKVIAAAKANRGGETLFQSKLWLFVLVLKTRHPASLAVLRGGGQQWWGGGWCIHDRLKRILHKYLTFLLSLFTDFLFVVFDKLLFMCHWNSIRMLPLSLLNSIVRHNMFYSSRSAFDSQILRWTRRASLTFPLGEHQMIHKSTAPGLYGPFPCQSHNDPEQHLTPGLHLLAAVKASAG